MFQRSTLNYDQLLSNLGFIFCLRRYSMVRLGAMHYCTNAAKFIPDLSSAAPEFEASSKAETLSAGTVDASRFLDSEIESLRSNSAEGTDYFQAGAYTSALFSTI